MNQNRIDANIHPATNRPAILVVDDDEMIRELLSRVLEPRGYEVVQADNGHTGLLAFGQNREQIQLVISDVRMPVMDGWELTTRIRTICGRIPIILISGYWGNASLINLPSENRVSFLQKPFRVEVLVDQVDKLVHEHLEDAAIPASLLTPFEFPMETKLA